MITIVNYGMGNLGSLANMFKKINIPVVIESDPDKIQKAKKIILPGVGAFDSAMERINSATGLREVLNYKAQIEKIPILGVCLGMQLLTTSSEEGQMKGLDWIPGKTIKFVPSNNLKVPHMGWNEVKIVNPSDLSKDLDCNAKYYFVHSYYVLVADPANVLFSSFYSIEFNSAIVKDNIFGVQFHPEKSHRYGIQLLTNFGKI